MGRLHRQRVRRRHAVQCQWWPAVRQRDGASTRSRRLRHRARQRRRHRQQRERLRFSRACAAEQRRRERHDPRRYLRQRRAGRPGAVRRQQPQQRRWLFERLRGRSSHGQALDRRCLNRRGQHRYQAGHVQGPTVAGIDVGGDLHHRHRQRHGDRRQRLRGQEPERAKHRRGPDQQGLHRDDQRRHREGSQRNLQRECQQRRRCHRERWPGARHDPQRRQSAAVDRRCLNRRGQHRYQAGHVQGPTVAGIDVGGDLHHRHRQRHRDRRWRLCGQEPERPIDPGRPDQQDLHRDDQRRHRGRGE